MSNSTNETKYFDLHTVGIGYLNRIREVKPRKGSPFMAVTVAALKGTSEKPEYAYIDCNVVGCHRHCKNDPLRGCRQNQVVSRRASIRASANHTHAS
ncbi:DUF3577 domain-containing protein, partial [Pseudomonas meliae]|uniref:DUF3577 domain-containing protein n=1 Tax=Pseudomonas meliae TaxID=86176 RepID=UPI000ACF6671